MLLMELNKIKSLFIICFLFSFANSTQSQTFTKYWVKFKDKNVDIYQGKATILGTACSFR